MQYRRLGSSGLKLSALSFGAWLTFGNQISRSECRNLVAAALGDWLSTVLTPEMLRWIVAASFLAVALWTLKPDTLDEGDAKAARYGAFFATTIAFFIAEIGDKTQVATVLLAVRFHDFWWVVAGTTVGMLLANVPVVLLGSRFADRLPLKAARLTAAAVFAALGLWALFVGIG